MSEGAEAGNGEDGRPSPPAGPPAVSASAAPLPLHGGPQGRDDVPPNAGRKFPPDDLSDDRPTMPPAPGKREAALRWAMPEPAPAQGPGLDFSQPVGRLTWSDGHRPPPYAGPSTSPSGSALPPARDDGPTGPIARTSLKSPSPALVTQPVPVAHAQPVRAEVGFWRRPSYRWSYGPGWRFTAPQVRPLAAGGAPRRRLGEGGPGRPFAFFRSRGTQKVGPAWSPW